MFPLHQTFNLLSRWNYANDFNTVITHNQYCNNTLLIQDFRHFKMDQQLLKQYYESFQIPLAIQYSIRRHEQTRKYPFNTPYLFLTTGRNSLQKRKKRFEKLMTKLKAIELQSQVQYNQQFLRSIKSQYLENEEQEKQQARLNISQQQLLYNIYQHSHVQTESKIQQIQDKQYQTFLLPILVENQIQGQFKLYESQISNLICDFQDVDINRILNQYRSIQNHKKYIAYNRNNKGAKIRYNNQKKQSNINYYDSDQQSDYFKSNLVYHHYPKKFKNQDQNIQRSNKHFQNFLPGEYKKPDYYKHQRIFSNIPEGVNSYFYAKSARIEHELLKQLENQKSKVKRQNMEPKFKKRIQEESLERQEKQKQKMDIIKLKAAYLINKNNKSPVYKTQREYQDSQFFNINPHLKYN